MDPVEDTEAGQAGLVPLDPAVKPPLSYIALIATVILSSPEQKLSLAAIYRDIEARFPYFRSRGQGWKNSVRHNLSLNECFIKLGRCEDGKGSYWAVHPAHRPGFMRGDFRQHRKAARSRALRGQEEEAGLLAPWVPPPPIVRPVPTLGWGPPWNLSMVGMGESPYGVYVTPPAALHPLCEWGGRPPYPGAICPCVCVKGPPGCL